MSGDSRAKPEPGPHDALIGFIGLAVILVFALWLLSSCWNAMSDGSSEGPTGQYSDVQCETLRFEGLGDGPGADDALAKWSVHC